MVREGLVSQKASQEALSRMSFTLEKACFADCCLVVESTVERMDAKQAFFREISQIVPEQALLATNTSGLKITEIATACQHPERFMGQHWLNPPHLLPLCEIIAGERTSPENLQRMRKLVEGLGMRIVDLVREDVRPRDIVDQHSIQNALSVDMALGCSTNTMLHLP